MYQNFTQKIKCNYCGNETPMEIVATHREKQEYSDKGISWDEGTDWELLKCPACWKIIFSKKKWHSEEIEPIYEILYPAKSKDIEGLPEKIADAYTTAMKVKNIDTNGFGVLLGRVLDLVCIEQKANGKNLYEKLKDIADKGIIPERLAEMAHGLRKLRNIGAHADLGELTTEEIPILESLIKAILEYVYAAPAMITRVQEKLDALKANKN